MARNILHVDASNRATGSVTRSLSQHLVDTLSGPETQVAARDVGLDPLPLLTETWIGANFTPDEARTAEQRDALALSDALIAELEAADILVLGVPIYNFGVPAAFKAWIDLVTRARKTFKYTETGPVGLLEGKTAYVAIASGGTKSESEIDFATPYIRHILGFLGVKDVTIIAADQLMSTGEEKVAELRQTITALAA